MNNNESQSSRELLKDYQTSKFKDVFDSCVKAVISLLPWGVSQLYNDFVKSPSEKRLNKFLEALVADLERLKVETGGQVNLDNPSFQTTLMNALQIVMKNHQEEKILALKNAVLNSSFIHPIDDDLQFMFLHWIDEFTPSHLKVLISLKSLNDYAETIITTTNNGFNTLEESYDSNEESNGICFLEELNSNPNFYNQILKDLEDRGLVDFDDCRTLINNPLFKMKTNKNMSIIRNKYRPANQEISQKDLSLILENFYQISENFVNCFERAELGRLNYVSEINEIYPIKDIKRLFSVSKFLKNRVTETGECFLDFIKSPLAS